MDSAPPQPSMLEIAQALIDENFYVFPLQMGGKKPPLGMRFKDLATRDKAQAAAWWTENPNYNIGIYTGRYGDDEALIVVDIDERPDTPGKAGKSGFQTLEALAAAGDILPPTMRVRTPSGGEHWYYRAKAPVSQRDLGRGINTRSDGGYVVAPGSTIGGKPYELLSLDMVDAPAALIARCGLPKTRDTDAAPADINRNRAAGRVAEYLQHEAPLAIEGEGGDQTTFKVAARCKDLGVTADVAHALMLANWNDRCSPPWPTDELGDKVRNAYRYGAEAPGAAAPEAMFSKVEAPAPAAGEPTTGKPRLFIEYFPDVKPDISRPPLVDGLLDQGAMSVTYGESNEGKTFVALDIGQCIAQGRPWMGRDTEQGGVVYVAAEGGGQIRKRFIALRLHYQLGDIPMGLVPCPVDLGGDGADVQPLLDLIGQSTAKLGKVALVIVDTLSRAMAGGNENAPEDMTAFVRNIDRLRIAMGCHVMVVHHSGKDKAKGARGHSSLRAATDTEIEVAKRTITATKQRDMPAGIPIRFDLLPVELGRDAKGRAVTSCVVVPGINIEAERIPPRAGTNAAKALKLAQDLTMSRTKPGEPGRILVADWESEFLDRHYPKKRKSGSQEFNRALESLQEKMCLVLEGEHALILD